MNSSTAQREWQGREVISEQNQFWLGDRFVSLPVVLAVLFLHWLTDFGMARIANSSKIRQGAGSPLICGPLALFGATPHQP